MKSCGTKPEVLDWHKDAPDLRVPIEFEGIIAISLPMRAQIRRTLEAAAVDIPVLITGETGTGKDLIAEIGRASCRERV